MKINLAYGFKPGPEPENDLSNQEVTYNWVMSAIAQAHEKGPEGQLRRIIGRIQRKFDTAVDTKADDIQLEEAEKDLIIKSFATAKFPANMSKFVSVLEDEIDNLAKKEPAEPSTKVNDHQSDNGSSESLRTE